MFRKGPRPFYKLSDEVGLFPADELRSIPRPRKVAADLPDRRLQLRKSQSAGKMPLPRPLAPPAAETRDDVILPRKTKAMFVDSAFFSPHEHPTWEQQVNMAKKIAASLSDATNRHSRGQTMYDKRQKRSPKWIHQGGIPLSPEDYKPTFTMQTKPLLELVMNPQGQLLDLESLKDQGVIINTEGLSPELCSELIRDLHAASGRGGQIFARRKKRSEKWVVDEFHPEHSRPGDRPTTRLPRPQPRPVQRPSDVPSTTEYSRAAPLQPPAAMKSLLLEELWQPSQPPRFPTDGVYSPQTPQGWGSPAAAPQFPEPVEAPTVDTVPDIAPPAAGTASDMAPADTWDWGGPLRQQQHSRQQPPPTATLFDTAQESLKAMEERRKQGLSNYNTAPQGWSDHDIYYRPVTFTQTVT